MSDRFNKGDIVWVRHEGSSLAIQGKIVDFEGFNLWTVELNNGKRKKFRSETLNREGHYEYSLKYDQFDPEDFKMNGVEVKCFEGNFIVTSKYCIDDLIS